MSDARDDLLSYWDHTGESLEGTPLINQFKDGEGRNSRKSGIELSQFETHKLLDNLEETSAILRKYLTDLESSNEKSDIQQSTMACTQRPCAKLCRKCSQLLEKTTGTKTIIFSVILQGLNLVIQTVIDFLPHKDDFVILVVSGITMILLQFLNLILIIITSVKLAKQLYLKRVSGIFLAQSYVASVILFSGMYTVTRRLQYKSWRYIHEEDMPDDPAALIIELYLDFIYFSVSTATLCGTADITPHLWYNKVLVSCQMLLSFMYFASILGHVLSPVPKDEHIFQRLSSLSRQQSYLFSNYSTSQANSRATSRIGSRPRTPLTQSQNYGSVDET